MINNDIAIIGIDSHFNSNLNSNAAQCENIDQVERALYLGKCLSKVSEESSLATTDSTLTPAGLIEQSVQRMAEANALEVSNLAVVVICEIALDLQEAIDRNNEVNNSVDHFVSNLAEALALIEALVEQGNTVALIGVALEDIAVEGIAENIDQTDQEITAEASKSANTLSINTESADTVELNTVSFDTNFNAYLNSKGLAGLLLCSQHIATTQKLAIYACIKSFSLVPEIPVKNISQQDIAQVTEQALALADLKASDVGLVECSALAQTDLSDAEVHGLCQGYRDTYLNTAITSARSVVGEGAGFSQMLGLLRTVISLQQRYIPAISDWQAPKDSQLTLWQESSFYFPTEARPWYPNANGSEHVAAYSCLTQDSYCHVILAEHRIKSLAADNLNDSKINANANVKAITGEKFPKSDLRKNGFIASSAMKLILVSGDSQTELVQCLDQLVSGLPLQDKSLDDIAKQQYQHFTESNKQFTLVLLAESIDELVKEISLAQQGVEQAFSKQGDWKTPKGSYFSSQPVTDTSLSNTTNIGFMYPGIGATYVGLGRDLFHLFPEIYQGVAALADDIGHSLKDTLLNPRTIVRSSFKELKQLDLNLRGSLADIAEAGVGFACVFTQIFEEVFKVNADFATGYSMGEVSMYAALGCWQQPGLMSARLAQSTTFNNRLCGGLDTLRECWDLSTDELAASKPIWETYTIKATLAEFEQASQDENRVYCTIVNTPDSLLLGGYPTDCLRVIDKLGVRAMPLNMANAIHSAPAKAEYDDMVSLYTMDVNKRIDTKMYSSSCYLPVPQFSGSIAHSIAKCLCEQVDFPRLVNTLYDKGSRVFIEMGPGRSLSSWVDKILPQSEKPHVSVPVNAKGTSDEITYFRAIAKLLSHGVKLELDSIFNGSIVIKSAK